MLELREDSTLFSPLHVAAIASGRRPRASHGQADAPEGGRAADATAKTKRQRVVLIAEDYEDTRALYAEHLTDAGFKVLEAADGEQAVALALALRPDAIIMDLSMPKVDGWDATRRIRALPEMSKTYIAVLSAMDGEISRSMAFDAGCDDFIRKPFLAAALVDVLRSHFRNVDRGPKTEEDVG